MQKNSIKSIGIIGGGQLGRMTILEARKLNIPVYVLTPEHPSPASEVADGYIVGDLYDSKKIQQLSEMCHVLTFEIEHINADTLKDLENQGKTVIPSSGVLEIIQDKSLQKSMLQKKGLPLSNWAYLTPENQEDLLEEFGYPVVQKACRGGYDGRGVKVLHGPEDLADMIDQPSFLEEYVPFDKEVAVIVARNASGQTKAYPLVEMEFDEDTNICDITLVPARVSTEMQGEAQSLAIAAVQALEGQGIFAVEMFLTRQGTFLINEIAPRPHNSGHFSIEGCQTSQYQQFLRAILDLPLGSTELTQSSVMINLLGERDKSGPAVLKGMEEALGLPGIHLHNYGKKYTKPLRKMGHITALASTVEEALEKAKNAKEKIQFTTE